MRGHVGTVTRGQARKREGARWHGDTWARADDERIGGSVDQKMHPFQVAGGGLGWQVAGCARHVGRDVVSPPPCGHHSAA